MTIWTTEQVNNVRRLYVEAWLAEDVVARHAERALQKPAELLAHMAETFGVDVDSRDVVWQQVEYDRARCAYRYIGQWAPATPVVELIGGQADGQLIEVQDVHHPLKVPVIMGPVWVKDGCDNPSALMSNIAVYEPGRWNESDHRWVFDLSATR